MAATEDSQGSQEDIHALHDRLDDLWAQYLRLLDDYSAAQDFIKKHLASGFFSLTQANFKSSGRRFGKDFYNDRAVALMKAKVHESGNVKVSRMEDDVQRTGMDEAADGNGGEKAELESHAGSQHGVMKQLPSPSPTPEPHDGDASADGEDKTSEQKSHLDINDPIRWFGILVPQALRSAQVSFHSAVGEADGVARAVNAARNMRDVEVEIRKLRKMIKKSEKITGA